MYLRIADDKCDSFHYCPHAFVTDMTNFINRCKFRTNKWRIVLPMENRLLLQQQTWLNSKMKESTAETEG